MFQLYHIISPKPWIRVLSTIDYLNGNIKHIIILILSINWTMELNRNYFMINMSLIIFLSILLIAVSLLYVNNQYNSEDRFEAGRIGNISSQIYVSKTLNVLSATRISREVFSIAFNPDDWVELATNYSQRNSLVAVLSIYRFKLDRLDIDRVLEDMVEYCEAQYNLSLELNSSGNVPLDLLEWIRCGVDIDTLTEYIHEGKIIFLAIETFVYNSGDDYVYVYGPGPICGYTYNLNHLFVDSANFIREIPWPPGELHYKIVNGSKIVALQGICFLASKVHDIPPKGFEYRIYGFIMVEPFEIEFKYVVDYGYGQHATQEFRFNVSTRVKYP